MHLPESYLFVCSEKPDFKLKLNHVPQCHLVFLWAGLKSYCTRLFLTTISWEKRLWFSFACWSADGEWSTVWWRSSGTFNTCIFFLLPFLETNSKDWIPGFESQWGVSSRKLTGKWCFWRWFFFSFELPETLEHRLSCCKILLLLFLVETGVNPNRLSFITQCTLNGLFLCNFDRLFSS